MTTVAEKPDGAASWDIGESDLTARLEQQLREMQQKYNQTRSYWSQTGIGQRRESHEVGDSLVSGGLDLRAGIVSTSEELRPTDAGRHNGVTEIGVVPGPAFSAVYAAPPEVVSCTGSDTVFSTVASQQRAAALSDLGTKSLQPSSAETSEQPSGLEMPQTRPRELAKASGRHSIQRCSTIGACTELTRSSDALPSQLSSLKALSTVTDDLDRKLEEYEAMRVRIAGFLRLVSNVMGNAALEGVAAEVAAGRRGSQASSSRTNLAKFLSLPPSGDAGRQDTSSLQDGSGSDSGSRGSAKASSKCSKTKFDQYIDTFRTRSATFGAIVKAALAGNDYMFTGGACWSSSCKNESGVDEQAKTQTVQKLLTDARERGGLNLNLDDGPRATRYREALEAPETKSRSWFCTPMPASLILLLVAVCCGLNFVARSRQNKVAITQSVFRTPSTTSDNWKTMVQDETSQQIRAAKANANMKLMKDSSVLQSAEAKVEVTLMKSEADAATGRQQASTRKAAEAVELQKRATFRWDTDQKKTKLQLREEVKSIEAMQEAYLKSGPNDSIVLSERPPIRSSGPVEVLSFGRDVAAIAGAFLPALALLSAFVAVARPRSRNASRRVGKPSSRLWREKAPDAFYDGALLREPLICV